MQNRLSFFTRKALHIVAPFCPLIGICQTAFENTFDCHIINIHSVSFCLGMQFDFQHKAIISSRFCVVLHRAMSQCIIMTVQHCEECKHSPASLSKQLHCISKVESPLSWQTDQFFQQKGSVAVRRSSSTLIFLLPCFTIVNVIITAVLDWGRQFGRRTERRRCLWHVYGDGKEIGEDEGRDGRLNKRKKGVMDKVRDQGCVHPSQTHKPFRNLHIQTDT